MCTAQPLKLSSENSNMCPFMPSLTVQVRLIRGTSIDIIFKLNMRIQISVPPHSPQIQSGDSRIDTSRAIAGVYNEGDIMDLTCVSVGGEKFEF